MCLERAPEHLEQVAVVGSRHEAGHVTPVQLDQADQRDRIGVGDVLVAMLAAELLEQDPFFVGGPVTGPGVREQLSPATDVRDAVPTAAQAAFRRKPGLVMKIQERCCQGLSAFWASQRRTGRRRHERGDAPPGGLAGQFRARPA
ncbi:hypothetical protein ACFV9D_27585 [Streptomyces sp. NPDC059875]|uniref:hypothetical protein n=1 Tax=unclassified Streptomyces TaxID=2593676 RepID=UPI003656B3BA